VKGTSLLATITVSCLLAIITGSAPASIVDIGGAPIYTEQDTFTQDSWAVTVTSFVFDATSASVPTGIAPLNSGETLFVYFMDMDNAEPTSVSNFSVGNPDMLPVKTVGWLGPLSIVPVVDGSPTTDTFQDPYLYGYSGPASSTIYSYFGNFFDPFVTLDPGEYSVVYFIAESTWQLVDGTATGAGISDNRIVPGPAIIPEPSLLAAGLLGLGMLLKLRRR